MSNIIKARRMILEASDRIKDAQGLLMESVELLTNALKMMHRERPIRRARPRRQIITKDTRDAVLKLARRYPDMTTQDIAVKVGLRSAGRVSEILHGAR